MGSILYKFLIYVRLFLIYFLTELWLNQRHSFKIDYTLSLPSYKPPVLLLPIKNRTSVNLCNWMNQNYQAKNRSPLFYNNRTSKYLNFIDFWAKIVLIAKTNNHWDWVTTRLLLQFHQLLTCCFRKYKR
jgi:hypothetical protein